MQSIDFLDKGPGADWVRRRAKLFEAGDYPDKGVTVAPETLQALANGFSQPVPVLVEHAESPLQLGFLIEVEAVENELFGVLSLSPAANALIDKSGAGALSLGISQDLSTIREVSVVRNPRVASARLFHDDLIRFEATTIDPIDFRMAYEALRNERENQLAKVEADRFIKEGRLLPCQRAAATALFRSREVMDVDGKSVPIRLLAQELIQQMPSRDFTKQLVPEKADFSNHLLLPEEAEFYRRHFPDVSLSAIAQQR